MFKQALDFIGAFLLISVLWIGIGLIFGGLQMYYLFLIAMFFGSLIFIYDKIKELIDKKNGKKPENTRLNQRKYNKQD